MHVSNIVSPPQAHGNIDCHPPSKKSAYCCTSWCLRPITLCGQWPVCGGALCSCSCSLHHTTNIPSTAPPAPIPSGHRIPIPLDRSHTSLGPSVPSHTRGDNSDKNPLHWVLFYPWLRPRMSASTTTRKRLIWGALSQQTSSLSKEEYVQPATFIICSFHVRRELTLSDFSDHRSFPGYWSRSCAAIGREGGQCHDSGSRRRKAP